MTVLGHGERKVKKLEAYKLRQARLEKRVGKAATIDLDEVYKLARCMLSQNDMAVKLGLTTSSRLEAMIEQRPEILEAIRRGQSETRLALGKAQLDLAMNGDRAMLIWLGKQYLGQSDKQESTNKTEVSITVQRAMEELRNIPKAQLLRASEALEAGEAIEGEAVEVNSQEDGQE